MLVKTISKEATCRFIEKKSSFTAYLFKVSSEAECKEKLLFLQNKHKDANHIPFAYRLHVAGSLIERFSDGGEPSKTAGFPLLKILRQEDLLGVAVFVVRIFGGIKLGPAGLMRAFSQSLRLALNDAGILEEELSSSHNVEVSVDKIAVVESLFKSNKIEYSIAPSGESLLISFKIPYSKNFLLDDLLRLAK
ncbi:MAG: IMPACT family protein [Candidatus Woesearchaeota archaeon]